MSKRRHFQARADFANGGVFLFGVTGRDSPAAMKKAQDTAAGIPLAILRLSAVRLYGRHHPVRRRRTWAGGK